MEPTSPLVHRPRTLITTAAKVIASDEENRTVCGLTIRPGVVAVVGRGEAIGSTLCPVCWPRR